MTWPLIHLGEVGGDFSLDNQIIIKHNVSPISSCFCSLVTTGWFLLILRREFAFA